MKYLPFSLLLVVVILVVGCVSDNQKTVITPSQTTIQLGEPIQPVLANNSAQLVQVITITVTPTSSILILDYPQKGRVQCGENFCPPDWFCCNNVCYDPKEGNTGYCCGGSVCPRMWGCCHTSYGDKCYDPSRYECVNQKGDPVPIDPKWCHGSFDTPGCSPFIEETSVSAIAKQVVVNQTYYTAITPTPVTVSRGVAAVTTQPIKLVVNQTYYTAITPTPIPAIKK
jgi:hypothetical protein